jgi:hypothetical protein
MVNKLLPQRSYPLFHLALTYLNPKLLWSGTPHELVGLLPLILEVPILHPHPVPKTEFRGQTIIITGPNTGLGLEAAGQLVSLKAAKVILAARTRSKGEAAKLDILTTTNATGDSIKVWPLDLRDRVSLKMLVNNVTSVGDNEAHIAINTVQY